eukprot:5484414-Pyramimonas_sp.AAC.1
MPRSVALSGVLHLPQATAASPEGRATYPTEAKVSLWMHYLSQRLKSRCRGHHSRQTASAGLFLRAKKVVRTLLAWRGPLSCAN